MSSTQDPLLHIVNVSKSYAGAATTDLQILEGVSFDLRAGESMAIVGPSGSGKSTLLNIAGTIDQPSSGQVFFQGQELSKLKENQLADFRNRELGFIFQTHHLLPQCTVLENVLVPLLPNGSRAMIQAGTERARQLLSLVKLDHRLDHKPGQLSGGEKQRVAVVRALINEPKLVLADEPTGALDQRSADQLGDLLTQVHQAKNVAILLVTHAMPLAERMQSVFELTGGRLARRR